MHKLTFPFITLLLATVYAQVPINPECLHGYEVDNICYCSCGWEGTNCNICQEGFFTENCIPCSNCENGVCENNECVCNPGYSDPLCSTRDPVPCEPECNNNGICDTSDGTCLCRPNFTQPSCEDCFPNYFGANCTECPNCDNGSCDSTINGSG